MQQSNVIEVEHFKFNGENYWRVTTDETHTCGLSYPAGFMPPNYPVPVIRTDTIYILNEIAAYPSQTAAHDFQDIGRLGIKH